MGVRTGVETTAAVVPTRPRDRFWWYLTLIVVVGVVLRVVYIVTARRHFLDAFTTADPFRLGDAYLYQHGAVLLAEGKGFINPYQYSLFRIRQQDASHPPLFMMWLLIPSILGIKSAMAHALWSVVLGAGTLVLVGITGRTIVGPRVGLIAAALAAVYPNVFSHDGFLQSETIAIFTVTLTVLLSYRFWLRPTMWNAVWVAAGCGLAMLSRSELVLFVPVLLIPLVLRVRTVAVKTRLGWLVAGGAALLILVGPWVGYNMTRFEKPVTLSDNFGYTLLTASCDSTYYGDATGYWNFYCAANAYDSGGAAKADRSVNDIKFRKEALDYIKAHKSRVPVVVLARWARYLGVWDLTHGFDQVNKDIFIEGRERWVAWGGAIGWLMMFPLAVYGTFVLKKKHVTLLPVIAPFVVVLIAVTVTFYMNRYRASAEAIVCLLAAVGIDGIWRLVSQRATASPDA